MFAWHPINNMSNENNHSSDNADRAAPEHKKSLRRSWRTSGPVAKLTVVFSGIAAGATVIYAIVAIGQFVVMNRQLTEIKNSSTDTHDLAIAAGKEAEKMETMSGAANKIKEAAQGMVTQEQRLADSASNEAHVSERAWIAAGVQSMPNNTGKVIDVGKLFDLRLTAANTGKTPAINVRTAAWKIAVKREKDGKYKEPPFVYGNKDFTGKGIIMPGQSTYSDEQSIMSEEDANKINSGSFRLYAHGRVEYDDIFGIHHWVTFCAFLLPSGAWANCPYQNDVDKNPN